MQVFVRPLPPASDVLGMLAGPQVTVLDLKTQLCSRLFGNTEVGTRLELLHGGRRLPDAAVVCSMAGLGPGSVLDLVGCLRGGGGDGGSTGAESRSCYLEMYQGKRPDKVNPAEALAAAWTRCHLSGEALEPPCVADELGSLYNKEAVVGALLRKAMPPALAYISSLKHLVDLKLERSAHGRGPSGPAAASTQATYQPSNEASFACPLTDLPMNGKFRFVVFKRSGHVISERALKDAPEAVKELVGGDWTKDDLIAINPPPEERDAMKQHVKERMAKDRSHTKRKRSHISADAKKPKIEAPAVMSKIGVKT